MRYPVVVHKQSIQRIPKSGTVKTIKTPRSLQTTYQGTRAVTSPAVNPPEETMAEEEVKTQTDRYILCGIIVGLMGLLLFWGGGPSEPQNPAASEVIEVKNDIENIENRLNSQGWPSVLIRVDKNPMEGPVEWVGCTYPLLYEYSQLFGYKHMRELANEHPDDAQRPIKDLSPRPRIPRWLVGMNVMEIMANLNPQTKKETSRALDSNKKARMAIVGYLMMANRQELIRIESFQNLYSFEILEDLGIPYVIEYKDPKNPGRWIRLHR